MEQQLMLVQPQEAPVDPHDAEKPSWQLDERTRDIGRRGLREARLALQRASRQTAA